MLLFSVNPHIWVRSNPWFPPIVEDNAVLKKYANDLCRESNSSVMLREELVNDLVSSLGGCLIAYVGLVTLSNAAEKLKLMKTVHTEYLMSALDLQKGQTFSEVSLERYELLHAIASGEIIMNPASPAAKYLLAKHEDIPAFLGIHPNDHLVFALPMTKHSLMQIEPLIKAKKL
jgi:hypothetical protein